MQQVTSLSGTMWEGTTPPLTVKPRRSRYIHMRVAVVHDGTITDEDDAHTTDLAGYVRAAPPTVFIVPDPSTFLATLDYAWCEHPHWRYSLSRVVKGKADFDATISHVKLTTFGFAVCDRPKQRNACPLCSTGNAGRKQRLHQCWDPRTMSPTPIHKMIDGGLTPASLLAWGMDVREWARSQNLELRTGLSGYAAQLLRDTRFYPAPRRRVPRATNDRARPHLPGNLVRLIDIEPGLSTYNVTSIDQRSAHHRIAQDIDLPDANTLYARGFFTDPENAPVWAPRGTALYERVIEQPGLVYAEVSSRRTVPGELRLRLQDFTGTQRVWLWTNCVRDIEACGTRIEGLVAAWTSTGTDSGLSLFGKWATSQIQNVSPSRKLWLKPLLHSTYGLLAASPRPIEVGRSGHNRGGKSSHFQLGPRTFLVTTRTLTDFSPPFTNVIQRGMIEAETQQRSLQMARELTQAGCRVLHIHTDGLHVEGNLPILPDTWGINGLTDVMYLDNVSWVARERDCLPGRDARMRVEVMRHYAGLHRTINTHQDGRTGNEHRNVQRPTHTPDIPAR